MSIKYRALTESGLSVAVEVLEQIRRNPHEHVPRDLLEDDKYARPVGGALIVPTEPFESRFALGGWLHGSLQNLTDADSVLRRPPFWSWLALALFPLIRPNGAKVYEDARYILNGDDYRKRYRHLLAGPYYVYAAHSDNPNVVRGLLATPPEAPGDLYEQLASRKELVTSAPIMEAVTKMYINEANGSLKRGASGSARRLAEVLMQFDLNFDFESLPTARLMEMLPREFQRFIRV